MKVNNRKYLLRIVSCCLSFTILATLVIPASATDNIGNLEQSTSNLQNELSSLQSELTSLTSEISSISAQAASIRAEITEVQSELAIAKGQEASQYDTMKMRIKYMYENGHINMLELLLSSSNMAEFLKRAEFISSISAYDRATMNELTALQNAIKEKEQLLIAKQESISELQTSLASKQQDLQSKIANVSSDLIAQSAALEAAKLKAEEEAKKAKEEAEKAEEALKQEVKPVKPKPPQSSITNGSATSFNVSQEDLELFAALIECEAGSTDYDGMLAVASVVVNRMKSPRYPDTLRGVIYQSGQFPPAHNGSVDKKLERGVKSSCLSVAQEALAGKNNVGDCLSFRAASTGHEGTIIGGNVFF